MPTSPSSPKGAHSDRHHRGCIDLGRRGPGQAHRKERTVTATTEDVSIWDDAVRAKLTERSAQ